MPDSNGKLRDLEDFRGKVVVLHFWATWCAPCLEEIPQWVELARAFQSRPVVWVAVSLDKTWGEAHRYLKPEKLPPNLISLLDAESRVPELFGSFHFPETYLLGPDLKVLSKWVGPQNWESGPARELLNRVLELTVR